MNFLELTKKISEKFFGREEEIRLAIIALISKSHVCLFGPAGTAKSAILDYISKVFNAPYFHYLLTKFSKPDEIFGTINIKKLREEGIIEFNTENKLPNAKIAFIDEIFKASSPILNSLLMILNEREFHNGTEIKKVPLWSMFCASNELPEPNLEPFYDRILYRTWVEYIPAENWGDYIDAYIRMHNSNNKIETLDFSMIEEANKKLRNVDISQVKDDFLKILKKFSEKEKVVSDRRIGRCVIAISASAIYNDRMIADKKDLMILKYVLPDTKEQYKTISNILSEIVGKDEIYDRELNEISLQLSNLNIDKNNSSNLIETLGKIRRSLDKYPKQFENRVNEIHEKIKEAINKITETLLGD